MKTKLLCLFFLLLTSTAFGQAVICGRILSNNSAPLFRSIIMIEGSFDGCYTDENGYYLLNTSLKGDQILIVKSAGYITQHIPVYLGNDSTLLNFQLKEINNELNTVTITAGTFEAGAKTKSVRLSSIDMITVPGAQGNVIGAINFLPGTSTNGESGKLFVRGGSSEESQSFIDGALVPIPYNPSAPNTAVRSKFNPFIFDGTVFSTGGFSAEYGQALSSVLLLETKGLQEEDQLDISIMSVGLGLAGTKKWEKSALTISANMTHLGPYMQIVPQNIDWVNTPLALNFGMNYRYKTKNGLFKVYNTYSQNRFTLIRESIDNDGGTNRFDLTNKNYYGNLNYCGGIGKNWTDTRRIKEDWLDNLLQQYSYFSDRLPIILDDEHEFKVKIPILKQA